jgi:Ras-related C3 botulinum toxin substrate 1
MLKFIPELGYYLPNVKKVLVGTKCDLRLATLDNLTAQNMAPVSIEQAKKVAKEIGAVAYVGELFVNGIMC